LPSPDCRPSHGDPNVGRRERWRIVAPHAQRKGEAETISKCWQVGEIDRRDPGRKTQKNWVLGRNPCLRADRISGSVEWMIAINQPLIIDQLPDKW
jgi:hypothetical protein